MSTYRLTPEASQAYAQNGYYLFHQPVFSEEKFTKLKVFFENLLSQSNIRGDELDTPHFEHPELFEFLLADEVLDLVEPLIGPNIGLWSSHFISKEPFTGRATPWHEDTGYWKGRFDRMDKIVTVWLALDKVDQANGCMAVIPGTHKNGYSQYEPVDGETNSFSSQIKPDSFDENQAVYFELEPNQCSLHDGRIIHGAKANTSPRRRAGYTMRYFSLEMKLDIDDPRNKNHLIYGCRGENIANNPLAPIPSN